MSESDEYAVFAERFKSAIDTWKFQVDSYWTRNSYFAVFETAAAAGIWKLVSSAHWWTSLAFSIGLMFLTFIWLFSNHRLHEYIRYWWSRAEAAEKKLNVSKDGSIAEKFLPLVYQYEENRPDRNTSIPYHLSIQLIPVLFLLGWLWITGLSIFDLCHTYCLR